MHPNSTTAHSIRRRVDRRTRQDRIVRQEQAFNSQMAALTEAYMDWRLRHAAGSGFSVGTGNMPVDAGSVNVNVVDVFSKFINFLSSLHLIVWL